MKADGNSWQEWCVRDWVYDEEVLVNNWKQRLIAYIAALDDNISLEEGISVVMHELQEMENKIAIIHEAEWWL